MKTYLKFAIFASLAMLGVCCGIIDTTVAAIGVGMAISSYAVGDLALTVTRALPTGASSVTSASIDLAHGVNGGNFSDSEFIVSAPALTVGQLANASTMTYAVVTSANSDMSSPTVINASLLVQTGAGGVGADAATARFGLPTDCQRYVGVKATNSFAADASAASVTLALKF